MSTARSWIPGGRKALWLAAALVLLGVAGRGFRVLLSERILGTHGAAWIWAPGALDRGDGLAFYAVRDFELDEAPAAATLAVLADEEYIAFLNGRRVGSGIYYTGAEPDLYQVGPLLRTGSNRLALELRSGRGAGGLLLVLADGDDVPLVVSGGDWDIHERAPNHLDRAKGREDTLPALVWQTPPHGLWGYPGAGRPRTDLATASAGFRPRRAASLRPIHEPPRKAGGKGRRGILADFGEPVTGYLVVGGVAHGPRRILASLALAEDDEGEPFRIVRVPGQEEWSQAETTTFRYVRLWGALPDEIDPVVVEVHPAAAAEDAARREARGVGVFGLEPPRPAGSDGSS